MLRLIQGDVGCGKTILAFIAALVCVENGYQVAFMAPTEILAQQHNNTFVKLFSSFILKKINVGLLISNLPVKSIFFKQFIPNWYGKTPRKKCNN